MRLTRRKAVLGLAAARLAGLFVQSTAARAESGRRPVAIRAVPIPCLLPSDPERRRFGALSFRSGLVLTCEERDFGGLSALWLAPDGGTLVSLTDHGFWLSARIVRDGGRLTALAEAEMAPVLGLEGILFGIGRSADTESLAIADGIAFVGVERRNEVLRFEWARDGLEARGEPIPVPAEVKDLPGNKGLEAVGIAPAGHPLAGALIGIAERSRDGDEAPTRGFILTGPAQGAFDVVRSGGFEVTDITFLPGGEMLLLERFYSRAVGVKARVRRIAADAVRPGALVDGPVLFEADKSHEIDNMEGIATYRELSGATIVAMVSDDNFSAAQRTVLLEFVLEG